MIHFLQIPLAALLGIAVLLLLRAIRTPAARAARVAIVPWVAFFAAYDGVLGIATGSLTEYGREHPDTADTVIDAATTMVETPFSSIILPVGMVVFALVVFAGAGLAFARSGASAYAAIAVAIGGIAWTISYPLIGAPAMLVFLVGAAAIEMTKSDTSVTGVSVDEGFPQVPEKMG